VWLAVFVAMVSLWAGPLPKLKVSANGRHLQEEGGKPFFYLGDTAWEIFHRLTREDADLYLEDRAKKGFTVIQAVVLAELKGLEEPNAYGHLPLENKDPRKPVEAYFAHVDYVVNKAESLGMYVGMLPTWGRYWSYRDPSFPRLFTPESAREYGRFLGKRYKDKAVIWILGGDEIVRTKEERAILDAMAAGLKEGDGGSHLMTYHPRGPGQSSRELPDAKWIDFHMSQSSHGAKDHDTGLFIERDRAITPPKPALDGEPRYELVPAGFYLAGTSKIDWFDDYDVRQAAYWAMLAGACGHTYGHSSIWQMYTPGAQAIISARVPWKEALMHPGSLQMGLMKRLFTSRAWEKLEPDTSFVKSGPREGGAKIRAARASDGSFAFVYSPRGEAFTVELEAIRSEKVKASWWDPRYGVTHTLYTADRYGLQTFAPPTSGRGQDWLLILEAER
jgi:hypothetical protein